jgi:hypothetical protein
VHFAISYPLTNLSHCFAPAFAKKLQSLARKGNPELLAAFEASYEGAAFNQETFDEKFFLDNAHDIVEEGEDTD